MYLTHNSFSQSCCHLPLLFSLRPCIWHTILSPSLVVTFLFYSLLHHVFDTQFFLPVWMSSSSSILSYTMYLTHNSFSQSWCHLPLLFSLTPCIWHTILSPSLDVTFLFYSLLHHVFDTQFFLPVLMSPSSSILSYTMYLTHNSFSQSWCHLPLLFSLTPCIWHTILSPSLDVTFLFSSLLHHVFDTQFFLPVLLSPSSSILSYTMYLTHNSFSQSGCHLPLLFSLRPCIWHTILSPSLDVTFLFYSLLHHVFDTQFFLPVLLSPSSSILSYTMYLTHNSFSQSGCHLPLLFSLTPCIWHTILSPSLVVTFLFYSLLHHVFDTQFFLPVLMSPSSSILSYTMYLTHNSFSQSGCHLPLLFSLTPCIWHTILSPSLVVTFLFYSLLHHIFDTQFFLPVLLSPSSSILSYTMYLTQNSNRCSIVDVLDVV